MSISNFTGSEQPLNIDLSVINKLNDFSRIEHRTSLDICTNEVSEKIEATVDPEEEKEVELLRKHNTTFKKELANFRRENGSIKREMEELKSKFGST